MKGVGMNLELRVVALDVFLQVEVAPDLRRQVDAPLGVGKFHLVEEGEVVLEGKKGKASRLVASKLVAGDLVASELVASKLSIY